jgi:hypothetical protein
MHRQCGSVMKQIWKNVVDELVLVDSVEEEDLPPRVVG